MEENKRFNNRKVSTNKGNHYEDLLIALSTLNLSEDNKIKNFNVFSNKDNFEKFDDIVVDFEYHNEQRKRSYVRVNHTDKNVISASMLAAASGNFSIQKYFESYKEIQKRDELKNCCNCILYTNAKCQMEQDFTFRLDSLSLELKAHKHPQQEKFLDASDSRFVYKFEVITPDDEAHNEFKNFLNQFLLYPNQKDVDNLDSFICQKFKETYFCKKESFRMLLNFITNWSKREGNKEYLDKETVITKIGEILLKPYLCTSSNPNPNLQQFVEAYLTCECDMIITTWDINYTAFNKMIDKLGEDDVSRIQAKFLINSETEENKTMILWHANRIPLIIRFDENNKMVIYRVLKLFEEKPNRKFLLIGDNIDREAFGNFKILQNLNDLRSICKDLGHRIIEKRISFQGRKPVSFASITEEKIAEAITTDELFKPGLLQVGEEKEELPSPYIDQFVSKRIVNFEFLNNMTTKSVTVISCNNALETIKSKINNAKIIITVEEYLQRDKESELFYCKIVIVAEERCTMEQFKNISEKNNELNYHLFRINNQNNLEWVTSSINNLELQRYWQTAEVPESEIFDDGNKNINIVSAKPGAGKSVMLKYLKNNIPSNYWVVNVSFREHSPFFRNENQPEAILKYFLDFQSKQMCYDSITLKMREIFVIKKKMAFLWDGIDELPKEFLQQAIRTVQKLFDLGYISWVTTREFLQSYLEKRFDVFSVKIKEMSQETQKSYIRTNLESKCENLDDLDKIVAKTIGVIAATRDVAFLGDPLKIYMLTDLILKNPQKYEDLLNNTISLPDIIIHHFIKEKFLFCCKDKGTCSSDNEFFYRAFEGNAKYRWRQYEILALKTFLPNEIFDSLGINCDQCLQDLEQIKNNFGLVTKIDAEKKTATFVHNVYGEYFVAAYMANNIDDIGKFRNFRFEETNENVRSMFSLYHRCLFKKAIFHKY